jgi:ADP-ribosylglycohydrolase
MTMDLDVRKQGAVWGLFIGDALAMPVHWYYDRMALLMDYGTVVDYMVPKNPHPDSILWRSSYTAPGPKGEILHDQAAYWGRRGIHYHQNLEAGEVTLNAQLAHELFSFLNERDYDADAWLQRYIAFMTTPGKHRDTYVEEVHRHFFGCYGAGNDPRKCAAPKEKHIGGMTLMLPVTIHYAGEPERAEELSLRHLGLTHGGDLMQRAGACVCELVLAVLHGEDVRAAVQRLKQTGRHSFLSHPFADWAEKDDAEVVERTLSTACYVDYSVPAVVHLAYKYADDPEGALVANTNLGGDNVSRGTVLGAILGGAHGPQGFPLRWREGLKRAPQAV